MRIGVVVEGDLRAILREQVDVLSARVTGAVNRATLGLRDDLREQTRRVLPRGDRGVVSAWQQRLYPSRRFSLGAAGFVYSKAKRIHGAFLRPMAVSARGGRWLVVPLEGAIARGWHREGGDAGGFGKPRKWSAFDRVMKLRGVSWMPRADGRVVVGLRQGKGRVEPLFLLTRTVRLRGGLDVDEAARRWLDRLYSELANLVGRT